MNIYINLCVRVKSTNVCIYIHLTNSKLFIYIYIPNYFYIYSPFTIYILYLYIYRVCNGFQKVLRVQWVFKGPNRGLADWAPALEITLVLRVQRVFKRCSGCNGFSKGAPGATGFQKVQWFSKGAMGSNGYYIYKWNIWLSHILDFT